MTTRWHKTIEHDGLLFARLNHCVYASIHAFINCPKIDMTLDHPNKGQSGIGQILRIRDDFRDSLLEEDITCRHSLHIYYWRVWADYRCTKIKGEISAIPNFNTILTKTISWAFPCYNTHNKSFWNQNSKLQTDRHTLQFYYNSSYRIRVRRAWLQFDKNAS